MLILVIVDGLVLDPSLCLPHISKLFKKGAWTLDMKLSFPKTELALAVMLHGVDNCFLNIDSNDVSNRNFSFHQHPSCIRSLFQIIKPKKSCFVAGTHSFHTLFDPTFLNHDLRTPSNDQQRQDPNGKLDRGVMKQAVNMIQEPNVDVVIVYLEQLDFIAHHYGIGKKYKQGLKTLDQDIGQLLHAMNPKKDTLFLVSDHGRSNHDQFREHDQFTRETMKVPFFAYGNKVIPGLITTPLLHIMDITPTLCAFLNLDITSHPGIRGKIIHEILDSNR
jgi:predicted AlkP superfamily pyrophosphatase or phosphodiesterase